MRKFYKNFKESGMFMVLIMLLCSAFGIMDAGAMTAEAVNPGGGGAVTVGDPPDGTRRVDITREEAVRLILDTIDEKVTKIRPHDVVLDTISRHCPSRNSNNQVVRDYAIDALDITATLSAGVDAGSTQVALQTSDNGIFMQDQVIMVPGVPGYKDDFTTVDPNSWLQLYVLNKDTSGKPVVIPINGVTVGSSKNTIPKLKAGELLVSAGSAGGEMQIQTDNYSAVPTDKEQFLQKFMIQFSMSTLFQQADKEVSWTFSDQEEEAVYHGRRRQNISFWMGKKARIKARNAHMEGVGDIYFTGGIWSQAGKEFDFNGKDVGVKNIVSLMKHCFTGNASSKKKLMICGSSVIEAFEQVTDYTRTIEVGAKSKAHGLEFSNIVSKFGTLLMVHDQTFNDMGMADKFFILDVDFLVKWTMGWKVNQFDFRGAGISDSDASSIIEICGLVLKNPDAHSRGTL